MTVLLVQAVFRQVVVREPVRYREFLACDVCHNHARDCLSTTTITIGSNMDAGWKY